MFRRSRAALGQLTRNASYTHTCAQESRRCKNRRAGGNENEKTVGIRFGGISIKNAGDIWRRERERERAIPLDGWAADVFESREA